jgi:DNA-binding NtrC family response regulator
MPNERTPRPKTSPSPNPVFLGHSSVSLQVQRAIVAALDERGPVLVSGPSGTGKRTVAEILHDFSGRDAPLQDVVIHGPNRIGPIAPFAYLCPLEQVSLDVQARLHELAGQSRLIIGTRIDPDGAEGRARLHPAVRRWCQTRIVLPTLAERIEDVELLAMSLLERLPSRRPIGGISEEAIDALRNYDWPGNVTELEQVLGYALGRATGPHLEDIDLPPRLCVRVPSDVSEGSPEQSFSLIVAERRAIARAMYHARGNKRRAARLLQISKSTLYRKLAGKL